MGMKKEAVVEKEAIRPQRYAFSGQLTAQFVSLAQTVVMNFLQ
jgi:hypothetical protein